MHSPPLSLHSKLGCLLFFTDICSSNNAYMPTPPYYLGVSQIQHRSPAHRYRSPYLPDKIIFWAFLCLSLRFSPFLVQSLNFSYSEYGFLVTDNDYFWPQNYECEFLIVCTSCKTSYKGRTIRKVMGNGVGKKQKKKFMQKEGPIVTFSESLSFRNQQYYQAQYEETKITFFLWKETIRTLFLF